MTILCPNLDRDRLIEALGVGAAMVDVTEQVEDGRPESLGLRRGVATLVDSERAKQIYATMGETHVMSGGSAANTICCLARMGVRTGFIGKVAEDQFGEVVLHDMLSDGVEFTTSPYKGNEHTGRCLILVTPDAERTMCPELGASKWLDSNDIHPTQMKESTLLYLESYLLDGECNREAFDEALAQARAVATGVALSLSDPGCVERNGDHIRRVIEGGIDVLLGNREEYAGLTGETSDSKAADRLAEHVGVIAITSGSEGVLAVSGEERVQVPAMEIDEVVDTTGAGDLFAAGFLKGVLAGDSLDGAARLGCRAAGEVVQVLGARPAGDLRRLYD